MKYKNYPADLRQKICDILEAESHTRDEVAGIPYSTVCDIYTAFLNNITCPSQTERSRKIHQTEDK